MALPDLIEILPLDKPVRADITVPGSKSITNRALILAALAEGETVLTGALWSEDTQIMVECLQELGFMVNVNPDRHESCNRTIIVYGNSGFVPTGGTEEEPLDLFVGNAGTAARFLSAFVCLGGGVYRLQGVARMHERPQAALFKALRELGYRVESENKDDKLPVRIWGGRDAASQESAPSKVKTCTVSIQQSSQFASALLLCAKTGGWRVNITGENADESPYVAMTSELIKSFPHRGGTFQVEPDASGGSYFWAVLGDTPFPVTVRNWPMSGWQIDAKFPQQVATKMSLHGAKQEMTEISRKTDLGDSIMTAIVLAPFASHPTRFTELGRLRVQECERVVALRTELTKCGAKVVEEGDTLTVYPSKLHGAEIETYNDHRMAMCFAILGLKIPGIKIKNPSCVKKTFPNFFQKLATEAPHGLGAGVLDGNTRQPLTDAELFAD